MRTHLQFHVFYSCAAGAIQISAGCKMILIQGRVCFAYSIQKS